MQQGGHAHEGQGHAAVDQGQQAHHEGDLGQAGCGVWPEPITVISRSAASTPPPPIAKAKNTAMPQITAASRAAIVPMRQGQQERNDAPVVWRQIVQKRRPSKLC